MAFLALIGGWFRTNPRNAVFIGVLLLILFVAIGLYMKGLSDANERNEAARAVEVAASVKIDGVADTEAEKLALKLAEEAAKKKEELINAVSKVPDTVPDDVAVRTGCIELCAAGTSVADLPACFPSREDTRTCPFD